MKTLQNYTVNGKLLRSDTGTPIVVGNLVKLYLDTEAVESFPEYVLAVVQHPVVDTACGQQTAYAFEYDETELGGEVSFLRVSDVVEVQYASTGTGTVESVGLSAPSIFTVSNSPVTSVGTLTFALNSQTAAKFLGSPAGASGVPTFRAITGGDITNLEISHVTNLTTTTSTIEGDITTIQGDVTTIQGDITTIQGDISSLTVTINNLQGEVDNIISPVYDWRVTAGEQTSATTRVFWYRGGTFHDASGSIVVPSGSFDMERGVIYLKIARDPSSRAATAVTVEQAASLPSPSTEEFQYRPLAFVNVTGTTLVNQRQFGEIRVIEMEIVFNGETKLATFDMCARNAYDPPTP